MLMASANGEDIRNGRRSRRPSPNGQFSDDESGSDSSEDNGMRIGEEYQAVVQDYKDIKIESKHKALLIWRPDDKNVDAKLEEYLRIAKEMYGYNMEQALGMLFWHKHNLEKALADLPNFTPFPDEWTVEDKVLFEQAFGFHGKSFHRIKQMLPDKTISSLVKYYYYWKKTRSRTSVMDRHLRKLGSQAGSDESASDSDMECYDKVKKTKSEVKPEDSVAGKSDEKAEEGSTVGGKGTCSNCSAIVSQVHSTPRGSLCNSCYQYWRRTGLMRSSQGPARRLESQGPTSRHNPVKIKRKPPRGMHLAKEDLLLLTTGPSSQSEALLKQLETEVVSLKTQAQYNKQIISSQKQKLAAGIDVYRPPDVEAKPNQRWTNEELLLAVQGVRRYGKDFQAIAETIGNKSAAHIRSFFINHRRRYNLDEVVKEYEAEYGPMEKMGDEEDEDKEKEDDEKEKEEKMETSQGSGTSSPAPHANAAVVAATAAATTAAAAATTAAAATAAGGGGGGGAAGSGGGGGTPVAPPPLKHTQPGVLRGPPPLQQQPYHHQYQRLLPPRPGLLHMPPPLVRPNGAPAPAHTTKAPQQ